jgi:hypothetical protein
MKTWIDISKIAALLALAIALVRVADLAEHADADLGVFASDLDANVSLVATTTAARESDIAKATTATLSATTARVQALAPIEANATAATAAATARVNDLQGIEAKLGTSLDTVNRPCAPGPCGTLAETNKLLVKGGDVITTTQRNEDKETAVLAKMGPVLDNAAADEATAGSMLKTADAVEKKATASYLHPSRNPFVRTWRAASPFILPAAEIAGALAK